MVLVNREELDQKETITPSCGGARPVSYILWKSAKRRVQKPHKNTEQGTNFRRAF